MGSTRRDSLEVTAYQTEASRKATHATPMPTTMATARRPGRRGLSGRGEDADGVVTMAGPFYPGAGFVAKRGVGHLIAS